MTKTAEAKPREWRVIVDEYNEITDTRTLGSEDECVVIKVREILPGQITLTREQFWEACNKVERLMNYDAKQLERELFGEEG